MKTQLPRTQDEEDWNVRLWYIEPTCCAWTGQNRARSQSRGRGDSCAAVRKWTVALCCLAVASVEVHIVRLLALQPLQTA